VFDAAKRGEVCLWREDTLYRFVPGLYEPHVGLRLGPDDAAKVRAQFLSNSAELPAPQQAETQPQAVALASKSASGDVEPDRAARTASDGSTKKWTDDKLVELRIWRDSHTMRETAARFGLSEQRIRQLLPRKNSAKKPFAGLVNRIQ
jgi:hypothetical protein